MNVKRILKHLLTPHWSVRLSFPRPVLKRIEQAIRDSEKSHGGQLRFAIEAGMPLGPLFRGVGPRHRATQVFAQLNVWDTQHNSGVLLYVQLVDRRIEIVADRGISAKVGQDAWDAICRRMEPLFRGGRFEEGALQGIEAITSLLARYFPPPALSTDELPNRPVVL